MGTRQGREIRFMRGRKLAFSEGARHLISDSPVQVSGNRFYFERFPVAPEREENILEDVFRLMFVAQDPIAEPVESLPIAEVQRIKRQAVALPDLFYELRILFHYADKRLLRAFMIRLK